MAHGWVEHGRRSVYDSPWVRVDLVDIEAPDGHRVHEHHAILVPQDAAGCVVLIDGAVLMMWRHRFIPGSTGWEIPAGRLEPGETPEVAAVRETLEETGWQVGDLEPLLSWHPSPGISNQRFTVVLARSARWVTEPVDTHEAERIGWVPLTEIAGLIDAGELQDGMALPPLLALLRRLGG